MENTKLKGNRGFKIKNEISVVCAGDCNFIKPIQVMIKSIEVNTSAPVNVYILQKGWNIEEKKETIRKFSEEKIKIHFIQMDRDIPEEQLKVSATIPIEAYYRLFLDKLLPEAMEQVIYLDGDLLVEGDIKELWECHKIKTNIMNSSFFDAMFNFFIQKQDISCFHDNPFSFDPVCDRPLTDI